MRSTTTPAATLTLPFNETWTGANGAAWPATWQAQADQNGTATIQANAGQLVAPSVSTQASRRQTVASLPAGSSYDITFTLTVPAGQNDFSIGVVWRGDGTSDGAAVPGSRMFAQTGMSLRLDTTGETYLYRQNAGALTVLTPTSINVGRWVGTSRRVRIQQDGTAIRVRVWNAGTTEPTTWPLNVTDAGALTGAGKLSLAISAGFGGSATTSQTASFDELSVTGAAAPPPPPPAGQRRNWASMNAADRQLVIDGLQRAKASGAYDTLTRMHMTAMMADSNNWHRRPIFLPVHRWFLTQLEAAMGGVAMPYWDWATSQAFPTGLGGNGSAAQGYRVTDGPFVNWSSVIYNSSTGTFTTRAGILRQWGSAAPNLPTTAQVAALMNQTVYDASPWDSSVTRGLRNILEGWQGNPGPAMHNRVHEWVGGDMRAGTSCNDPIFWFHHANVDRIWAGWQNRRGVANYAAPTGQGPNDPMPLTGGVTPAQMFALPSYDVLP